MMARFRIPAFALLLFALAMPAFAQERILSYDSAIAVNADGSMDVTETIKVHAEGTNIRRGIYRDFPTRYKDRYGNRVVVEFTPISVLREVSGSRSGLPAYRPPKPGEYCSFSDGPRNALPWLA